MATRQDLQRFATSQLSRKECNLLALKKVRRLAQLDIGREFRKGLPEVVLAEGKDPKDVADIAETMVERLGRAIVSRADKKYLQKIRAKRLLQTQIRYFQKSGIILVKNTTYNDRRTGGRVGLLTAGTSDIPVAEEAEIIAKEIGCETRSFYDVGVAGIHRLFKPLAELLKWDADVIVVVAGREGALPTVIAGMVDVPVIAVPTSRSYGFGDKGVAALAAMLQSCSLGLAVVNIDSGVGAGSIAALIANRAAQNRRRTKR